MERILEMAKADTMIHNVVSVITAGNEEAQNYTIDSALPIVGLPLKLVLNMENIRIPKLTHYWYNNRY